MYATCLFCTRPLGRNETVEAFPVGRRLAFDARRGRLWVVCGACRGWNLTPLEERWEAIEACERLFRGTRLRVSTDHVGLARVGDGVELVRVGEPLRPELAAWRYGDRFAARRRRALVLSAAGTVAAGALTVASVGFAAATGFGVIGLYGMQFLAGKAEERWRDRTRMHVRTDDGRVLRVRNVDVGESGFVPHPDGLALQVRHSEGHVTIVGEPARRMLGQLLPAINATNGTRDDVRLALARIEHAGSAEAFLAGVARRDSRWTRPRAPETDRNMLDHGSDAMPAARGLYGLAPSLGLAIEMAAHEETERRALEGELAQLEQAWRDAEEIGRIADDLLLPERVARAVDRIRGR